MSSKHSEAFTEGSGKSLRHPTNRPLRIALQPISAPTPNVGTPKKPWKSVEGAFLRLLSAPGRSPALANSCR